MNRRPAVAALALALLPWAARADTPKAKISGPATVAPGGLLLLNGMDAVSDRPIAWELKSGPVNTVAGFTLDQGTRRGVVYLVPQMPTTPGIYKFIQKCKGTPPGAAEIDVDADTFEVTVTGTVPPNPGPSPNPTPVPPNPNPDPVPPPKPDPTPVVTGHLHLSYIADARSIGVADAQMKRNVVVEQGIKDLDANFRWFQNDEQELIAAHVLPKAQSVGFPCLLIQKPTGEFVDAIRNPTPESIVAKVRELRGLK